MGWYSATGEPCGGFRRERIGSRDGGRERDSGCRGDDDSGLVFEGGRSRRPVVYTGFGVKVTIVGSGGGVRGLMADENASAALVATASLLCERRCVVRVSCRRDTRVNEVILGRWRWASFMA